jgi:endonuclease/exonuclease/phosphatase family metal-dependent hydrolase
MKKIVLLLLVVSSSCCLNKHDSTKEIIIMSWNVQNLFDGVDNGEEYSEFKIQDGNWSNELYIRRLGLISSIIRDNNPDIIGLQEIEGLTVLKDLSKGYLDNYNYMFSTDTVGAIELGFLSKYPIERTGIIEVGDSMEGLRPILEVEVQINGSRLILFNNHWKSKSGGFSENLRLKSAWVLKKRLNSINPNSQFVLLGDFNENHDEYIKINKSYKTGIMIVNGISEHSLEITTSKKNVSGLLYSPWGDTSFPGSYLYKGEWETIDNFFLSSNLMGEENLFYKSFYVDARNLLFTGKNNVNKWISEYGIGYSDHLPIILTLGVQQGIKTSIE